MTSKIILQNESTNRRYSISNNTLIHLPSNSSKNMILHGIKQGKEIQLDTSFNRHKYVNETPVANLTGKVFTQDISEINTLAIKEVK